MTDQRKPTGKAISTSSILFRDSVLTSVTFDEGSVWGYWEGDWECLYEPPTTKPAAASGPGSWPLGDIAAALDWPDCWDNIPGYLRKMKAELEQLRAKPALDPLVAEVVAAAREYTDEVGDFPPTSRRLRKAVNALDAAETGRKS